MALGAGQIAPRGGIWVLTLIGKPFMFLMALVAGMTVSALAIIVAKGIGRNPTRRRSRLRRASRLPQAPST